MTRCILVLVFACAALPAQESAARPPSRQFKENWLNFNSNIMPPRTFNFSVQPGTFVMAEPSAPVCSVPLLEAPIDPNIDWKTPVVKSPEENIDNIPFVKGLPPCASHDSKPEFWFNPRTK